jgi:hypothetical protein
VRPELADSLRTFWYRTCVGLIMVSSLFTFTIAVVLSVNHSRLKDADPLNAGSIQVLRDGFKADPGGEMLKEEIRQLDLLARRAWFGSVRFQEVGIYLLLAGSLTLVISLKSAVAIRAGKKDKGRRRIEDDSALGHVWWAAAAVVAGIAAGALLLTVTKSVPPETASQGTPAEKDVLESVKVEDVSGGEDLWEEMIHQWPSFRGPGGLAQAAAGPWPTEWDGGSGNGVVWKTAVPLAGGSSPVVWGDRVFLSGGDEESLEVYCFDADVGKLLWRYKVKENDLPQRPSVSFGFSGEGKQVRTTLTPIEEEAPSPLIGSRTRSQPDDRVGPFGRRPQDLLHDAVKPREGFLDGWGVSPTGVHRIDNDGAAGQLFGPELRQHHLSAFGFRIGRHPVVFALGPSEILEIEATGVHATRRDPDDPAVVGLFQALPQLTRQ